MGRPAKPDPIKHCQNCKAMMTRKRFGKVLEDLAAFRKRVFCDRACMAQAMEGTIRVMSDKNSRRQSAKTNVGSCQECGRSQCKLHVHHIDENPQNNTRSNLKTLCVRCHRLAHLQHLRMTLQQSKPCTYCSRQARHRGLCNTHYSRLRRHGNALTVKRFNGHGKPVYLTASA